MWGRIWAAYLLAVAIAFGVLEYLGVRSRNRGGECGTLSCALRRWLGLNPVARRRWPGAALFVAFLAWLGTHIITGRWP